MNEECRHNLAVCRHTLRPQQYSNWLVTQYVNISDSRVEKLSINVTYSTCEHCQQSNNSFSIWIHETDSLDEISQNDTSMYQYTGLNFSLSDIQNETVNAWFNISQSGLYLALVDTKGCTMLYRLVIYYDNNLLECIKCSTSPKDMTHVSTASTTFTSQEKTQEITPVSETSTMTPISPMSTQSTTTVYNDTTASEDPAGINVISAIAIIAGFVIVIVILIIIVITNVFLVLAVLKKKRMNVQKNAASNSARDVFLTSYDPYQAQPNEGEEEYEYDNKEGVNDVHTFTVQETANVQSEEDTAQCEHQQQ